MNENLEPIERLSLEYKMILSSREYRLGKKMLKAKYCLRHFKLFTLLKKLMSSRKMKYIHTIDNLSNEQIFENNSKNQLKKYNKNARVAIYTVNIGGYDHLIQPLFTNDKCDYYIVSDKKPTDLGVWKWIDANKYIEDLNTTNVKKARYIKTHPQLFFKDYDYSIFIDGNIRCITDITKYIANINKNTGIAIHPHPYRDCIYKESKACKITGKGNYNVMKKQVQEYKAEGMPELFGLFETNVVIRDHNKKECIEIMDSWWNEIDKKSERDQISLTYVLWKLGYVSNDIGIIYDSINNNPSVQVVDHIEEYEKENNNE